MADALEAPDKSLRCPVCGFKLQPTLDHGLTFVLESGTVSRGGRHCHLPPRHLDILEELLDAYPHPISADVLFQRLYALGDRVPSTGMILQHISRMRAAFKSAGLGVYITCTEEHLERSAYVLTFTSGAA